MAKCGVEIMNGYARENEIHNGMLCEDFFLRFKKALTI